MERVTGIEPASPAWKAGALAIVLHPHAPSVEIVSLVIIAYDNSICQEENRFLRKVFSSFSLRSSKKCGMIGRLKSAYTQRYRSGHNGADSKSSRSVDAPPPKTLDIAGLFGVSTFF